MFKNKPFNFEPSHGIIVQRDHKLQSSIKDGVSMTELVEFDDDYSKAPPLIRPEDFTLEKQLKAGIQLNRINVGGMLSPTDPASQQVIEENKLANQFERLQNERKSAPVAASAPVADPQPTE